MGPALHTRSGTMVQPTGHTEAHTLSNRPSAPVVAAATPATLCKPLPCFQTFHTHTRNPLASPLCRIAVRGLPGLKALHCTAPDTTHTYIAHTAHSTCKHAACTTTSCRPQPNTGMSIKASMHEARPLLLLGRSTTNQGLQHPRLARAKLGSPACSTGPGACRPCTPTTQCTLYAGVHTPR